MNLTAIAQTAKKFGDVRLMKAELPNAPKNIYEDRKRDYEIEREWAINDMLFEVRYDNNPNFPNDNQEIKVLLPQVRNYAHKLKVLSRQAEFVAGILTRIADEGFNTEAL